MLWIKKKEVVDKKTTTFEIYAKFQTLIFVKLKKK